jgi:hypothetical protein
MKKPLQDGKPIRGGDIPTIPEISYSRKFPIKAFHALEKSAFGLSHGSGQITVTVKDGHFTSYYSGGNQSVLVAASKGKCYGGYVPPEAIEAVEKLAREILNGEIFLTLHIRDGALYLYETTWTQTPIEAGSHEEKDQLWIPPM